MRWKRGVGRGQIEDRRGMGGGRGMGSPIGVGGGLGGAGLLIFLVLYLLGGIGGGGDGEGGGFGPSLDAFPSTPAAESGKPLQAGDEQADFVAFVVDDVQDAWARLFAEAERRYEPTKLVLFDQPTQTGCGVGSPRTGPFYCPADKKVYLELGFFRELATRFRAPGDFAQAYVIAHEFGHHVQNLLGISNDVRRAQQQSPDEANQLSVKLELQADCFAGVWAYSAYNEELLESGDVDEGLAAAAAVGDDRIQSESGRGVNPETWTHGSAEQRAEWFRRGFESGSPNDCDTFG